MPRARNSGGRGVAAVVVCFALVLLGMIALMVIRRRMYTESLPVTPHARGLAAACRADLGPLRKRCLRPLVQEGSAASSAGADPPVRSARSRIPRSIRRSMAK
jgi:hypothetical protein